MPSTSALPSNIKNRSPRLVLVRSKPPLDQQFTYGNYTQAETYLKSLANKGLRAKQIQPKNSVGDVQFA